MKAVLEPSEYKLCHVRLRFYGEQGDLSIPWKPPKKGEMREVAFQGGLCELAEHVEKWLGSPGEWKLNNVANWPLSEEALQRPTTKSCPLVVNVVNRTENIEKDVYSLQKRLRDLEDDVKGLRHQKTTDMKNLNDRLDKLGMFEEYWDLLTSSTAEETAGTQVRSGRSRRCWAFVNQPTPMALWLGLLGVILTLSWAARAEVLSLGHDVQMSKDQFLALEQQTKHSVRSLTQDQSREHAMQQQNLNYQRRELAGLHSNISRLRANMSNLSSRLSQAQARAQQKMSEKMSGKINVISNQIREVEEDEGKLSLSLTNRLDHLQKKLQEVKNHTYSLQQAQQMLQNQSEDMEEELTAFDSRLKPLLLRLNHTVHHVQVLEKESRQANSSWAMLHHEVSEVQDRTLPDLRTAVAKQAASVSNLQTNMSSWHQQEEKYSQKGMDAERKVNMVEKEVQKALQKTTARLQEQTLREAEAELHEAEAKLNKRVDRLEGKLQNLTNTSETQAAKAVTG